MSPNGIAIINAYPAAHPGLLREPNWIATAAHPINQRKGTLNIDCILLNDKHHISGRRTDASYFEYQPFDQGSGLTGKYFNRPNQTNTVSPGSGPSAPR